MKRLLAAALPALVAAAPVPSAPDPAALRASVAKLVSFGTRHTASSATDPRRGIGAARSWAAGRFTEIGRGCGGCLTVERPSDRFSGPRAPDGVVIENVLAIQPGTGDPDRVVIISAHIDSRVTDVMDATSDAPGANDDGSGSALVLEAARMMAREKYPATIVYALLSGEEQGLWGGELLARIAKAKGWQVAAVLNNDIVGNTHGIGGEHVDTVVRVFSEGIRGSEELPATQARRANGGEDDGPSRALAKLIDRVAGRQPDGLDVFAVRRYDRFSRGGDQMPMLAAGYPAVRFTEATENYDRQHQNLRRENGRAYGDTIEGVDFPYLAKVTALNIAAAREIARAPAAPGSATISGAVSDDTTLKWAAVPGAPRYRVRWRRADRLDWTDMRDVTGTELLLPHVNIDDHFFGVSALSADGAESLVTFAGPAPRPPVGSTR